MIPRSRSTAERHDHLKAWDADCRLPAPDSHTILPRGTRSRVTINWPALLPGEDETGWLYIDVARRNLEVMTQAVGRS